MYSQDKTKLFVIAACAVLLLFVISSLGGGIAYSVGSPQARAEAAQTQLESQAAHVRNMAQAEADAANAEALSDAERDAELAELEAQKQWAPFVTGAKTGGLIALIIVCVFGIVVGVIWGLPIMRDTTKSAAEAKSAQLALASQVAVHQQGDITVVVREGRVVVITDKHAGTGIEIDDSGSRILETKNPDVAKVQALAYGLQKANGQNDDTVRAMLAALPTATKPSPVAKRGTIVPNPDYEG